MSTVDNLSIKKGNLRLDACTVGRHEDYDSAHLTLSRDNGYGVGMTLTREEAVQLVTFLKVQYDMEDKDL